MNDEKIIDDLLTAESTEEIISSSSEFRPIFNVREEFVVWIEKEFPNLEEYIRRRKPHPELERRFDEVYQAALGAVNHGTLSTTACANALLRSGWNKFKKGYGKNSTPYKRSKGLYELVKSLKKLSLSLGGDEHYTDCGVIFLDPLIYNKVGYIYRDGDGLDENTTYLVFDSEQNFGYSNSPVFIGQIFDLTSGGLRKLKERVEKFKGTEDDLISIIDKEFPVWSTTYTPKKTSYSSTK